VQRVELDYQLRLAKNNLIVSQYLYPKESRLLNKDDFLRMRSNSKKIVTKSLIFFIKENDLSYARLGFAVSKKVGKAYVRNIHKRIIKEQFRCSLDLRKKNIDILIVGKKKQIDISGRKLLEKLRVDLCFSFNSFLAKIELLHE